jgi:hypothetical protein
MDVTWGAFEQISRTLQLRPQDLQHPPPSLAPSLLAGDSNDKDAQTQEDGEEDEDEEEDEDAR